MNNLFRSQVMFELEKLGMPHLVDMYKPSTEATAEFLSAEIVNHYHEGKSAEQAAQLIFNRFVQLCDDEFKTEMN